MKLIKTIRDADLGMDFPPPPAYEERKAARAVVFDPDGNVTLLHATQKHYHKLPGGGVEKGESIEAALRREVLEEIGCSIEDLRELGMIEEYRNKLGLHQLSYCFTANVTGEKGEQNLEAGEMADGHEPEWLSIERAIQTLERESGVEDYEGKFIQMRDLAFLKAAASQIPVTGSVRGGSKYQNERS